VISPREERGKLACAGSLRCLDGFFGFAMIEVAGPTASMI